MKAIKYEEEAFLNFKENGYSILSHTVSQFLYKKKNYGSNLMRTG